MNLLFIVSENDPIELSTIPVDTLFALKMCLENKFIQGKWVCQGDGFIGVAPSRNEAIMDWLLKRLGMPYEMDAGQA